MEESLNVGAEVVGASLHLVPLRSMKIILWNCQGMGNPLTVHSLKGPCRSHSPEIGFFSVTMSQSTVVESRLKRCGFHSSFHVNPDGKSGRLAVG